MILQFLSLGDRYKQKIILLCLTFCLTVIFSPSWGLTPETEVNAWVEQGKTLYQTGRYAEAINPLQQALQIYQTEGDKLKSAMVFSNLALVYQKLGWWEQGKEAIQKSLQLLQTLPNNSIEKLKIQATTLDIQGQLQFAIGQSEQAIDSWQQAAKFYQQSGNELGRIRAEINLAQALQNLGFYRRAVQTLTELTQTLQTQSDSFTKAVGLRSLGNALQLVGNLQESQTLLTESLTLAERLKSSENISAALLSLGNTARLMKYRFLTLGDTASADQQIDKALNFYQQAQIYSLSLIQTIQSQLNQLSLLIETKQDLKAQKLSLQIKDQINQLSASRPTIYAQINYAQSLLQLQQEKESEQILRIAIQQAQTLKDQQALSYALGNLGGLYEKRHQWPTAQNFTEQALNLAQAVNDRDIMYQWQWQLGRILNAQGKLQEATLTYEQAVNTLQSLRSDLIAINPEIQYTFQEKVEPIYRDYVGLLLQTKDNSPPSQQNLERARETIDSLQLVELENFFRATCLEAQPVLLDKITNQDDPTAAIIYPIILTDHLEIIVKLPQQPLKHYTIPIENSQIVKRNLTRLVQVLPQRNIEDILQPAQRLYDWLIRPLEKDLEASQIKTLVFVLDSPLRNIPMSVLYDGNNYLVEKYALAITPGLQLLDPQPLPRQKLNVFVGGLTEARDGFNSLPYVKEEISQISANVNTSSRLIDQEFTQTAFENKITSLPFPVVHLATHGQFSSQAENTFILTWDGRLNANQLDEILKTKEQQRTRAIELLVLSACETLRGDERAALGLAGVAVKAGARSTLATLWQVNDEASAVLIGQFYQALTNPQMSKAEALRQAQQTLLKDPRFDSPYFWAAYVLVGNWL